MSEGDDGKIGSCPISLLLLWGCSDGFIVWRFSSPFFNETCMLALESMRGEECFKS